MNDRLQTSPRAALAALLSRRAALATLLVGAVSTLGVTPVEARKRRNPRKRLRTRCRKQCKRVYHDCRDLCRVQGYPDDLCHPRCSTAKRSCRGGC